MYKYLFVFNFLKQFRVTNKKKIFKKVKSLLNKFKSVLKIFIRLANQSFGWTKDWYFLVCKIHPQRVDLTILGSG